MAFCNNSNHFININISEDTLVFNRNDFTGHGNNAYNYNSRDDPSYTSKNWNGFAEKKNTKLPSFPNFDNKREKNLDSFSNNANGKTTSYSQNRKGRTKSIIILQTKYSYVVIFAM